MSSLNDLITLLAYLERCTNIVAMAVMVAAAGGQAPPPAPPAPPAPTMSVSMPVPNPGRPPHRNRKAQRPSRVVMAAYTPKPRVPTPEAGESDFAADTRTRDDLFWLPATCPACGAAKASTRAFKPGRRKTTLASDPRNNPEHRLTTEFLTKHIVVHKMTLRAIKAYHMFSASTLSRAAKKENIEFPRAKALGSSA